MVVKGVVCRAGDRRWASPTPRVVEIRQGLSEQDQVILQGKDLVKAKQKVRTVPATEQ